MTTTLDLELRERLAEYLEGTLLLKELYDWLSPAGWNIDSHAPPAADLFHEVELLLAEYAHGDWTEEELRQRFSPLVTSYTVLIGTPEISVSTTADTRNIELTLPQVWHQGPPLPAGTRFVEVSA